MDWVVFASCFVTVCAIVIDLIKSSKDKSKLSDEHQSLNKGQERLENASNRNADLLNLNLNNISRKAESISSVMNSIDKSLYAETEKNKERYANLTTEQRDIKKQIEAISALMNEVERLQTLVVKQQQELDMLYAEKHQNFQHTQNHKFTQTMK